MSSNSRKRSKAALYYLAGLGLLNLACKAGWGPQSKCPQQDQRAIVQALGPSSDSSGTTGAVPPKPRPQQPSKVKNLPNGEAASIFTLPLRLKPLSWLSSDTLAVARIGIQAPAQSPNVQTTKESWGDLSQALQTTLDSPPASPMRALPMFLAFALRGLSLNLDLQLAQLHNAQILPLEAALLVTSERTLALLWPLPEDPKGKYRKALAQSFGRELELHADYWSLKTTPHDPRMVLGLSSYNTLAIFISPISKTQAWSFMKASKTPAPTWIPTLQHPGTPEFYFAWVGQHLLESTRQNEPHELPVVGQMRWSGRKSEAITINGKARTIP